MDGYPGMPHREGNAIGNRSGRQWMPPECDLSIRHGWFYHAKEDTSVKSVQQLLDIYYGSVGHGASLNLNVPLDQRGLIADKDAETLLSFRHQLDLTFADNLARGAQLTASNVRGRAKNYGPENLVDGDRETYWCTDDSVTAPMLVIKLKAPKHIAVVLLREYLPLGQRIEGFELDQKRDGQWEPFFQGTSIGNLWLARPTAPVFTDEVRLRITKSPVCPALSEVGLFEGPPNGTAAPNN
jgi:alpha-L-fucosidase